LLHCEAVALAQPLHIHIYSTEQEKKRLPDQTAVGREGKNLAVSGAVTGSIFSTSVVRVVGLRRGRFVEFNFSPADPTLEIDLIMPATALAEFCRDNNATLFVPDAAIRDAFMKLCVKQGARELLSRLRDNHPTRLTWQSIPRS
jgi:hypothetical protein